MNIHRANEIAKLKRVKNENLFFTKFYFNQKF